MKFNFWEVNCDLCPYFSEGGCGGVGPGQLDVTLQHNCARISEAGISLGYFSFSKLQKKPLFFFFPVIH